MKKLFLYILLFCCAVRPQSLTAQHWQAVFPSWNVSYNAFRLYEDTATDRLYIAGGATNGFSYYDGNTITPMGSSFCPGQMREIIIYHDTLYVAGPCVNGRGLMKWNGSDWDSTGIAANGPVSALCIHNGELYAGGVFTQIGGVNAVHLAKYNGSSWSAVSGYPLPGPSSDVWCLASYNGELYVGGQIMDASGNVVNIVRWNGTQWNTVGGGFHGGMDEPTCFEIYNNALYIGGCFTMAHGNVGDYIAKWDGTTLSDVGGGVCGIGHTNGQISDLMAYNNELYAVGAFDSAGGVHAQYIARWDGTDWCGFGDTLHNIISALGTYHGDLFIGGPIWLFGSDTIAGMAKWIGGNYTAACGNTTSIEEQSNLSPTVIIYPNPTNGKTTFALSNIMGSAVIRLFDNLGREVWRDTSNSAQMIFDAAGTPAGLYYYRVEQNGKPAASGKLVIQ